MRWGGSNSSRSRAWKMNDQAAGIILLLQIERSNLLTVPNLCLSIIELPALFFCYLLKLPLPCEKSNPARKLTFLPEFLNSAKILLL